MKRSYVAPKLESIGSIQEVADELDGSTRVEFVSDRVSDEKIDGDAHGSTKANDGPLLRLGDVMDVFGLLRG